MADAKAAEHLAGEAAKALELLARLEKEPADAHGSLTPRLLKLSKGVIFTFTKKGGLGLGWAFGSGFSLFKTSSRPDGTATWSPPCFLSAATVSMGATIGLQDAASLSCMLSERAAKYMQSHGVLESEGAEKHLTAWGHAWATGKGLEELEGRDAVSVGWSSGLLVDLSWATSELRVDKELNKAAYGLEVGPQELLSTLGQGGAPAPAQFAAVYDKLNEMIRSCKVAEEAAGAKADESKAVAEAGQEGAQ